MNTHASTTHGTRDHDVPSLADRYVWALVRAVPEAKRVELEPEFRELVDDAVEAEAESGSPDAERTALVRLGDPIVVAAKYLDRPFVLLGPALYPAWARLLSVLLPTVVPSIVLAMIIGNAAAGTLGAGTVGQVVSVALQVAVNVVFWTTLGFVALERYGSGRGSIGEWSPDDLPQAKPDAGPARLRAGFVGGVVMTVVFVVGYLVQWRLAIYTDALGEPVPVLDPALLLPWIPVLGVLAVLKLGVLAAVWRIGRWTFSVAAVNAVVALVTGGLVVWLFATGQVVNPEFMARLTGERGEAIDGWISAAGILYALAISLWDVLDAIVRAARSRA